MDELAMYFAGKFSVHDQAGLAQAMWCIVEPDLPWYWTLQARPIRVDQTAAI
ncbi:hypothetical protein [Roseibium sediminis]|uniref:hypothetical protein n=1 Tax=Roseibium sediminis TaxID=1775174 RepID=UPI0013757118|nr:hypothetical protein [Roseibium sediminis]